MGCRCFFFCFFLLFLRTKVFILAEWISRKLEELRTRLDESKQASARAYKSRLQNIVRQSLPRNVRVNVLFASATASVAATEHTRTQ